MKLVGYETSPRKDLCVLFTDCTEHFCFAKLINSDRSVRSGKVNSASLEPRRASDIEKDSRKMVFLRKSAE